MACFQNLSKYKDATIICIPNEAQKYRFAWFSLWPGKFFHSSKSQGILKMPESLEILHRILGNSGNFRQFFKNHVFEFQTILFYFFLRLSVNLSVIFNWTMCWKENIKNILENGRKILEKSGKFVRKSGNHDL